MAEFPDRIQEAMIRGDWALVVLFVFVLAGP